MHKFYYFFALFFLLSSCSENNSDDNVYQDEESTSFQNNNPNSDISITGKVKDGAGLDLILESPLLGNKVEVARAMIDKNENFTIQTVHEDTNPKYYKLLVYFKKITNCPIIVNTSFNVRDEPIVCTIQDAYKCFMGTDLDMLVCGNYILYKDQQNIQLKEKYKSKFNLD